MIGSEEMECREDRLQQRIYALRADNAALREENKKAWAAFMCAWAQLPPGTTMEEAMSLPSVHCDSDGDDK